MWQRRMVHKNKPGVVFYVARVGLQGLVLHWDWPGYKASMIRGYVSNDVAVIPAWSSTALRGTALQSKL